MIGSLMVWYRLQAMSSVNPADYLRRFSSHLMLEPQDMRVRTSCWSLAADSAHSL